MFGGQLVDDPLKPTECTLDQPGAIAGLQFLQDLVYKYGYAPSRKHWLKWEPMTFC